LPASYGSRKKDDIPFTARVEKWQNERNMEMKAKSTLITQGRLAECTFHPKINDNSEKAAKVVRGPESMDRLRVSIQCDFYSIVVPVVRHYSASSSHRIGCTRAQRPSSNSGISWSSRRA